MFEANVVPVLYVVMVNSGTFCETYKNVTEPMEFNRPMFQ